MRQLIIFLSFFSIISFNAHAQNTPQYYGANATDMTSDYGAVQALINYCAANNVEGIIPDGNYIIDTALKLPSNLTLTFAGKAVFTRAFNGSSGSTGSLLTQTLLKTPVSNITLNNFHYKSGSNDGRVMTLNCNDLTIRNLYVEDFQGAICLFLAGDRVRVESPVIKKTSGVIGEGGIRFVGGSNFMCSNAYVESGDDCFQFVPAANPDDSLFNKSIKNSTYINCKGISYASRVICTELEENNSCTVQNNYFINVTGKSGGYFCVNLSDQSSAPTIGSISFSRTSNVTTMVLPAQTNRGFAWFNVGDVITISGDADVSSTTFNGTFTITSVNTDKVTFQYSDPGGNRSASSSSIHASKPDNDRISGLSISDVTVETSGSSGTEYTAVFVDHIKKLNLVNTRVLATNRQAMLITNLSKDIYVGNFYADKATSGTAFSAIEIDTSTNVIIDNASLYANGSSALTVGKSSSPLTSTNVTVKNSKFYNMANTFSGINFLNCVLPVALNCYFEKASGATTSRGVTLGAGTSLGKVIGNSFENVDNSIVDLGTGNIKVSNTP